MLAPTFVRWSVFPTKWRMISTTTRWWQTGHINHMGNKSPQDSPPLFTCITLFQLTRSPLFSWMLGPFPPPPLNLSISNMLSTFCWFSLCLCLCSPTFFFPWSITYPLYLSLTWMAWVIVCCWKFGGRYEGNFSLSFSFSTVRRSLNKMCSEWRAPIPAYLLRNNKSPLCPAQARWDNYSSWLNHLPQSSLAPQLLASVALFLFSGLPLLPIVECRNIFDCFFFSN